VEPPGHAEGHHQRARGEFERIPHSPGLWVTCMSHVPRMYLACGSQPPPKHMACKWLGCGLGGLSSRSRPHSRSGEKAVGTTNDPKNTNWQRFGTTEVLTGLSSSVHFVSRSFMMCLVYSVVSPAVLGFSGPRCLPLPQNCRASLQALSHYPATFHHGRHKCTAASWPSVPPGHPANRVSISPPNRTP